MPAKTTAREGHFRSHKRTETADGIEHNSYVHHHNDAFLRIDAVEQGTRNEIGGKPLSTLPFECASIYSKVDFLRYPRSLVGFSVESTSNNFSRLKTGLTCSLSAHECSRRRAEECDSSSSFAAVRWESSDIAGYSPQYEDKAVLASKRTLDTADRLTWSQR